jgi:hypothetical protein
VARANPTEVGRHIPTRLPRIDRRQLATAAVAIAAFAALWAPASSRAATAGECELHSLPTFTAQGIESHAASVADIVEVSCFEEAGQPVVIEAPELYARCGDRLKWYQPAPYAVASGPSFTATLDKFGNATAAMWTSQCKFGETQIKATLGVSPSTSVGASFDVQPPEPTEAGAYTLPEDQVEGATDSFATILQVEFPSFDSLKEVELSAGMYHSCNHHLEWITDEGKVKRHGKWVRLPLDNDGNAFAIVLGGPRCASNDSLIVAELIDPPFTTYTTAFFTLPPREVL